MERIEFARELRRRATDAELSLWRHLRGRQLLGHKVRRQEPICEFIVDFVCREAMVIVEIDGAYHEETANRDRERADVLEAGGYAVVRFTNAEVLTGVGRVLESIRKTLSARLETLANAPVPSPGASRRPLP